MLMQFYHGAGGGGWASEEGRESSFKGQLHPGRHLFTTDDPNIAYRYARDVWTIVLDIDVDTNVMFIPRSEQSLTPEAWIIELGLTPEAVRMMPPYFKRSLRDGPDEIGMNIHGLWGKGGDSREYSAADEKKFLAAIKTAHPHLKAVQYSETFHDLGYGKYEYNVYVILDQADIVEASPFTVEDVEEWI